MTVFSPIFMIVTAAAIGGDTSGGDTSECSTTITECGTRLGTLGANFVTNAETFCRYVMDTQSTKIKGQASLAVVLLSCWSSKCEQHF